MEIHRRNRTLTLATFAGGLLATTFLPMAVAFADDYDFTPSITTFVPSQVEGYPPLIEIVTGAERWDVSDLTTNSLLAPNIFTGTDTQTTIGSFANDDYLTNVEVVANGVGTFDLTSGR